MNPEVLKSLKSKFPKRHIKQRTIGFGNFAKEIDYVEGSRYISRLNDVLEGEWTFTVKDRVVDLKNGFIAILGHLEVPVVSEEKSVQEHKWIIVDTNEEENSERGDDSESVNIRPVRHIVVKEQWGSKKIERYRKSGDIVDLGNDLKAATTDSLKKCASLLGVGLHLYEEDEEDVVVWDDNGEPVEENVAERASIGITEAQKSAVEKVMKLKKVNKKDMLSALEIESIDDLDKIQAGSIITLKHPVWRKLNVK
jgi:hypothetical protein